MLLRKHRRRREKRRLFAFHDGFENSPYRHFGFAVTHVAAKQSVHYLAAFHIAFYIRYRRKLVFGFGKLEIVFEFFLPGRVRLILVPFSALSRAVDFQQVDRHFFDALTNPVLNTLELRSAEFVQSRLVRSGVFFYRVELLYRQKQFVAALVKHDEKVLFARKSFYSLHTFAYTDTVLFVHDVIALKGKFKGLFSRFFADRLLFSRKVVYTDAHKLFRRIIKPVFDVACLQRRVGVGRKPDSNTYIVVVERAFQRFERTFVRSVNADFDAP